MSTIEVNKITPVSGGTTVQVGESGDTINIPAGATIANAGTSTGFGATLTGSTDNTVVTVTGANAMQGEANLTYDGTELTVGEASSNNGYLTISADDGLFHYLRLTNGGSSNTSYPSGIWYSPSGSMEIRTASGATNSNAHQLVLDSSGRVNINTASAITGEGVLQVKGNSSQNVSAFQVATNGNVGIRFFNSSTSGVGSITVNSSSTSYGTSSDYRLKENQVAISDGITRLKTLKPYRFNFKTNADKTVDGFFAHEVTAVPEAISGTKDAVDADDKIISQGIDQSKLVPLLTAALKEAITKIETLETKVQALEDA